MPTPSADIRDATEAPDYLIDFQGSTTYPILGPSSASGCSIYSPAQLEQDRQEHLILSKLGERGLDRLADFGTYPSGWGSGDGQLRSVAAYRHLLDFLEAMSFPDGVVPSVFMTPEGGLEIAWEDAAGKTIEVEFARGSTVRLFREATNKEIELAADAMLDLVARVAR